LPLAILDLRQLDRRSASRSPGCGARRPSGRSSRRFKAIQLAKARLIESPEVFPSITPFLRGNRAGGAQAPTGAVRPVGQPRAGYRGTPSPSIVFVQKRRWHLWSGKGGCTALFQSHWITNVAHWSSYQLVNPRAGCSSLSCERRLRYCCHQGLEQTPHNTPEDSRLPSSVSPADHCPVHRH
jgi:hypothetical protein